MPASVERYTVMSKLSGGLYIHVPFCRRKCIYCDFYSGRKGLDKSSLFIEAVLNELHTRRNEIPYHVSTIYIGGGTPSLLQPLQLGKLMEGLGNVVPGQLSDKEITIEVNPEDVSENNLKAWRGMGINRISMGVQTLDDKELKTIGRTHSASKAIEALELIRKYFSNISIDLIFGLPGQTPESLAASLSTIISYRPEHVSCYSLMYEERTAITRLREIGKIEEQPEDITVGMYEIICKFLAEYGYSHYEISNFCQSGFESRHNLGYWTGKPYIGLGPSAHSYNGDSVRKWNIADTEKYINCFCSKDVDSDKEYYEKEILSDQEKYEEFIMTRLRMKEGLNFREMAELFGEMSVTEFKRKLEGLSGGFISNGLIGVHSDGIFLTEKGMMTSDSVIIALF